MAQAILIVLLTALFTMVELWLLKMIKLDVLGRLNRAQQDSDTTRFFLEALVLVAFILIQPAILIGLANLASPDVATSARQGFDTLFRYGMSLR